MNTTFGYGIVNKTKQMVLSVSDEELEKVLTDLLDIDDVQVGDTVIVLTDRGRTEVTVAAILEKAESELALPIGKYKKIVEKV